MNMTDLRLGKRQFEILNSLREHGSWTDSQGTGWVYDSYGATKKTMDQLVNKGLARVAPDGKWNNQTVNVYYPT